MRVFVEKQALWKTSFSGRCGKAGVVENLFFGTLWKSRRCGKPLFSGRCGKTSAPALFILLVDDGVKRAFGIALEAVTVPHFVRDEDAMARKRDLQAAARTKAFTVEPSSRFLPIKWTDGFFRYVMFHGSSFLCQGHCAK